MIRDTLLTHFDRYPAMQAQDAVKLIYQQEFGPGHLIRDEKKALALLREEMAGLEPGRFPGEALYEPIGNGLCRLNLRPCLARGIGAEDICRLFCETARTVRGDRRRFQDALRELEALAEEDLTPFEAIDLDVFLIQYRDRNCPAVHHSPEYRAAYAPAYRVVQQRRLKDDLAARRRQRDETGRLPPRADP